MSPVLLVVGLVALQRLGELVYAARNTRALLRAGGREVGRGHYPLFILLHGGLLVLLPLVVPADQPVRWPFLVALIGLQLARLWVIASLGRYWTTRIITLPAVPLVRRGPYRYLRHPNYLIVAVEVAVLPLVFDAWLLAIGFSLANLALLSWRIAQEDAVLAPRRSV